MGGTKCPYCGGEPVEAVEPYFLGGVRFKGEEGEEAAEAPAQAGIDRRRFLIGLGATGVTLAGVAGGMAYVIARDSGGATALPPGQETPTAVPAKPVDVDEISRHPTEMPDSADYTLFDDDKYQKPAQRSGPMTHEVHFHLAEVVAQMVDGTTMDFWTFDKKVPGPMVRARVGDTMDFFLHNPDTNGMPHNVDFHAVTGPGGGSARLHTAPGAVSNLRVKMLNPGIYIYHCAFPDIPDHISHGMYGLAVVEPEGGLPSVDHEYYLMQSEFYTDKGGRKAYGQLKNAGHLANSLEFGNLEEATFVVWNGRPESIAGDRAIGVYNGDKINTGETVRLFVGNIGPNYISSFHVIGEIFDKVYVEGSFDLVNRNVQTTLAPSGGAVGVEFKVEVPGDYLAVDHAIFRIHKGAVAIIHAEGPENPDVYESIQYSEELGAGGH
ncbi:MAG: copper-containing nitrite reductase [Dehalococcoidia bacterium]|nr:copper-containing nitrite reductase [Dehalococcoidia bacterium]